jgi:hypothetical protein
MKMNIDSDNADVELYSKCGSKTNIDEAIIENFASKNFLANRYIGKIVKVEITILRNLAVLT